MGRGGQLGMWWSVLSAISAEQTTATPHRRWELEMGCSNSGARRRSMALAFVGGGVVRATGHLPQKKREIISCPPGTFSSSGWFPGRL